MDPISMGVAFSIHMGFEYQDEKFNSFHPYAETVLYDDFTVGMMVNSEHRVSFYVKNDYRVNDSVTVEYGLATGYENVPVVPLVRYSYHFDGETSVWVMPGYARNNDNQESTGVVVGIQFKF